MESMFKNPTLEYKQTPRTPKTGAFDFSWLNDAPAGKHGFVKTDGENFVFEDGTPVRFFGGNIAFSAAFPSRKVADAMAEELASNGANFARLHATTFGGGIIDISKETTQEFHAGNFERLDYLIYALKRKGIYIHLDTVCGRSFKTGDGFTEEEVAFMNESYIRAVRIFDKRCVELDRKMIMGILNHFNPFTGLRYADDPAIAIVQYVNEHDITWLTVDPNKPNPFDPVLDKMYNEWLLKRYGSRDALDKAWTNDKGEKALKDDEDPERSTVRHKRLGCWHEPMNDCTADYTNEKASPARHADFMRFLYETQTETFRYVREGMREVGVKCPVNCSNSVCAGVSRALNAQGDVMENNSYWNHPIGPYTVPSTFHLDAMTDVDPRINTGSGFHTHSVGPVSQASVAGKPLIITEWNAATVCQFKADAILQVACYGALQNWAGFLLFVYSFDGYDENAFYNTNCYTSYFNSNIDPSMWGQFGIAAAIFRLGLVSVAKNYIEAGVSETDLWAQSGEYWKFSMMTPFVSKFKFNHFKDKYEGNADLVISGGYTASGDYSAAKRLVLQSYNEYSDELRKHPDRDAWLHKHSQFGSEKKNFAGFECYVGDRTVIAANAPGGGTFGGKPYDAVLTEILRHFSLISDKEGWFDDKVVSDTGELSLNFGAKNFTANTDRAVIFAGNTNGKTVRVGDITLDTQNDKLALAVLSLDNSAIANSGRIIVYAMGRSGNSGMEWDGPMLMTLGSAPILYEDIRGKLFIPSVKNELCGWICDHNGRRISDLPIEKTSTGFLATLGSGCYYEFEAN